MATAAAPPMAIITVDGDVNHCRGAGAGAGPSRTARSRSSAVVSNGISTTVTSSPRDSLKPMAPITTLRIFSISSGARAAGCRVSFLSSPMTTFVGVLSSTATDNRWISPGLVNVRATIRDIS